MPRNGRRGTRLVNLDHSCVPARPRSKDSPTWCNKITLPSLCDRPWSEPVRKGVPVRGCMRQANSGIMRLCLVMGRMNMVGGANMSQRTIDLIQSLRPYQSVIVPLIFTPMETTRLESAKPLLKKDLSSKHYELITACWDHNLDWFPELWANYGRDNSFLIKTVINLLMRFGTEPVRKRVHRNARRHGANI